MGSKALPQQNLTFLKRGCYVTHIDLYNDNKIIIMNNFTRSFWLIKKLTSYNIWTMDAYHNILHEVVFRYFDVMGVLSFSLGLSGPVVTCWNETLEFPGSRPGTARKNN